MPTGVIEAAGKNKFGAWIKIGGEFKNSGKGLSFDLSTLNKGDSVEFEGTGKYINSIKVVGTGAPVPQSSGTKSGGFDVNKSAEIARSTAVKSVLGSPAFAQAYAKKDISETMSDAKLLIKEFSDYIISGSFTAEAE
jgi:hypothetical protein